MHEALRFVVLSDVFQCKQAVHRHHITSVSGKSKALLVQQVRQVDELEEGLVQEAQRSCVPSDTALRAEPNVQHAPQILSF